MKDAVLPPAELQCNVFREMQAVSSLSVVSWRHLIWCHWMNEWKVGKYKHSTKESVNDDRIKDSTKEGPYNARVNFINTHQTNAATSFAAHAYPQRAARSAQPISHLYKTTFLLVLNFVDIVLLRQNHEDVSARNLWRSHSDRQKVRWWAHRDHQTEGFGHQIYRASTQKVSYFIIFYFKHFECIAIYACLCTGTNIYNILKLPVNFFTATKEVMVYPEFVCLLALQLKQAVGGRPPRYAAVQACNGSA